MLGTTIDGRYRVRARIARGGMATVYRARDERLDRDVAVKIMHPHLADQAEFVDRFHREARAAARISSSRAVSVYDEGTFTGGPYTTETAYLVMEHMSGHDLRTELSQRGSFKLGDALRIMSDVLAALGAAHEAGLVHRDVKPENVMMDGTERAKVTDFGLARALEAASHTSTGTVLGTVAYLAPEVIEGSADARSDIYSAGIMLYELIAGEVPFTADSPIALAYKHMNSAMPRLSSLASWIPASVDSLLGVLTAKDPNQRPENGDVARDHLMAVLSDLDEIVANRRIPVIPEPKAKSPSGITEREPSTPRKDSPGSTKVFQPVSVTKRYEKKPVPPPTPQKKKHRWGAWFLVLFLMIASAIGVYWYFTAGPGMRIALPNVVGQQEDVATEMIETAGLSSESTEEYSDTVPAGAVISTDPSAPADLPKDTVITLTVSLGIEQVEVPNVEGALLEDATSVLADARLTPEATEEFSETVEKGHVISQAIAPGTLVDHSSTIGLVVSKGREPIQVPNLVGMNADEAAAQLRDIGLASEATSIYSETIEKGYVIEQSTTGELYRGDTVTLTVSLGPELFEVPDVFGKQAGEARQILEDAGFEVDEERVLGGIFNTVRDQSIPAGSMERIGTTIVITIV